MSDDVTEGFNIQGLQVCVALHSYAILLNDVANCRFGAASGT